jgi:uncharacterized protein (DUF849 family)
VATDGDAAPARATDPTDGADRAPARHARRTDPQDGGAAMTGTPVLIEVASNGLTRAAHNPAVPVGPAALAADARACLDSGASIVHTHAADPTAGAGALAAEYAACYEAVLAHDPATICYPTTAVGPTVADRYAHVGMLASQRLIRAAFVDPGSVNLGGTGPDGLPPPVDFVYTNTFADIRYAFDLAARHRLGPSVAVFEPGFLQVTLAYLEAGALPPGTLVKLYLAAGGYLTPGRALWGAPPIPEALTLYLAMLAGSGLPWALAVVGGSLFDHPELIEAALAAGGHLRVGLEDWPDGPANAEQVRRAAEWAARAGRPVASPAEAARILGLPD